MNTDDAAPASANTEGEIPLPHPPCAGDPSTSTSSLPLRMASPSERVSWRPANVDVPRTRAAAPPLAVAEEEEEKEEEEEEEVAGVANANR